MVEIGMGYVGRRTNPGRIRNVLIDGLYGIGPTGAMLSAHGLSNASGCPHCVEHIQNLTIRNVSLMTQAGPQAGLSNVRQINVPAKKKVA